MKAHSFAPLFIVVCVAYLRADGALAQASAPPSDHQRALDDAAALLNPLPAAGLPTAANPARASAASAAGSSRQAVAAPPAVSRPEAAVAAGAGRPAAADRQGPAPATAVLRRRIPDAIEGNGSPAPGMDGLAGLAIEGRLRVLDGRQAPFLLLATRIGSSGARAQLMRRGLGASPSGTPAWFEPGDSPAPGWRLVNVAAEQILLLTPDGNPLRLNIDAGTAAATANSSAIGH